MGGKDVNNQGQDFLNLETESENGNENVENKLIRYLLAFPILKFLLPLGSLGQVL